MAPVETFTTIVVVVADVGGDARVMLNFIRILCGAGSNDVPVILTGDPAGPMVGVNPVITGPLEEGATVNGSVLEADPAGVATTTGGIITTIAGDGTCDSFCGSAGMAIDAQGNVFIADSFNDRIRKVDTQGVITTVAGTGVSGFSGDGGPATSAQLNFPEGIAIDGQGNLFIADTFNRRIRKVDASGIITTVAGNGSFGSSGDGGLATSASFFSPSDVAVDGQGNLFIADQSDSRIRKVDISGVITTVAGNGIGGFSGDRAQIHADDGPCSH